ncbi:FG-GAP and VCBS repeat-containing protein [Streptomyces sp. NPDC058274]|uniref:FG-GAP and VCBS repeat-containing protein n=1 Tax=Streptomyces sp. NPDC058274 TaxID=3346416 RepID=UPI0036E41295
MRHRPFTRTARCCALVAAALTAPLVLAPSASAAPAVVQPPAADFDHDGYADVLATAPGDFSTPDDDYVAVRYGGPGARHQTFKAFGFRSAARDFDGDGYTDLAIGTTLFWGSAKGLGATPTTIPDSALFDGYGLTAGDFNGDGHADLVSEKTGDDEWGDLRVLYGPFDRAGTAHGASDILTGRTYGPRDLTAGDITGDGKDDLVTLHSFEEMSESSQLWKGTASGLATTSTTLPAADTATTGDVDKDGRGDLVIRTVPNGIVENLPYDSGTIKVLYGTASGPSTTRTTTITQNTAGVPGVNEDGDQFGDSLAAADVNGDGYADILAGIPDEDLTADGRTLKDAGSTVVLRGGAGGLTGTGAVAFTQDTTGVPGIAEASDHFGATVSLGDTNGDGRADLIAAAPGENTTVADTGAVWVLPNAGTTGAYAFNPGDLGAPATKAQLGYDLAHH